MSTWDLKATCDKMATAWAALTPPSGDTIRKAYGQLPNDVPMLPCGLIIPQTGTLELAPGMYRGHATIDGVLLIEKAAGDLARIETRRQKWLPILLHAFDGNMALDLEPVVLKAYPTSWDFLEFNYGGTAYDAIVVHYQVDTAETVVLAA